MITHISYLVSYLIEYLLPHNVSYFAAHCFLYFYSLVSILISFTFAKKTQDKVIETFARSINAWKDIFVLLDTDDPISTLYSVL